MSREQRPDSYYENANQTAFIKVLEALKGIRWEPVSVKTIIERTEFPRDLVDRTLKTMRMHGYATCEKGKWTAGRRLIAIAASLTQHSV